MKKRAKKPETSQPNPQEELLPGELPPIGAPRPHEKSGRRGKHPRAIYRVIVILLICVVALVIWINRENLQPQNVVEWVQTQVIGMGVGDGYPAQLNGDTVAPQNFRSVGKNLYLTGDTTILCMNNTAKALFSRKHNYADPVMRVKGGRVLVYGRGSNGYRVENQLKTLVSGEADDKILTGDVTANGRYALITEAGGYCGKLTAYLNNNTVAYRYWFSDYYPTAMALNSDGTKAAVAAVGAKDGAMVSAIYVLDFNSNAAAKPIATYTDTYVRDIAFDGTSLLAIGDKQTIALKADGTELGKYDYNGGDLTAWDLEGTSAVLAVSNLHNGTSTTLVHLDKQAKTTASAKLEGQVNAVSSFGDAMAAVVNGQVQSFSISSGAALGKADAGSDARALAMRSESEVYILGISEVRMVTLS